jgi:hypothetical protein
VAEREGQVSKPTAGTCAWGWCAVIRGQEAVNRLTLCTRALVCLQDVQVPSNATISALVPLPVLATLHPDYTLAIPACCHSSQQLLELCKDKAVVVLPAFETEEFKGSDEERHLVTFHKVAAVAVQFDKRTTLTAMMKQGLINPFDVYTHPTVRAPGSDHGSDSMVSGMPGASGTHMRIHRSPSPSLPRVRLAAGSW